MIEFDPSVKENIGDDSLIDRCLADIHEITDEDGARAYIELAGMLAYFDKPSATWMLESGPQLLGFVPDKDERGQAMETIHGMGRGKWSVAVVALKSFEEVSKTSSGFNIEWLQNGCDVALIDQDVAVEYFKASPVVLEQLGGAKFLEWAKLGKEVAGKSWKAAKEYFKSSPDALEKIEPGDIEQWARLGIYLIENSPKIKAQHKAQSMLAQGASAGKAKKMDLGIQYFKSAPQILSRLSIHDLEEWVEKGLEVTDEQKEKGNAFFGLQTGGSRKAVEGLVKGLELKDTHTVLRSYAEALIGGKAPVKSSSLFYKNLPGLARFFSVSDGVNIFLPSQVTVFQDEELNFKTYKLSLTHEIAHIEYGTFKLATEDMKTLSDVCDPALAVKIFEFLEDERVDFYMNQEYPGLERDRKNVVESYIKNWVGQESELSVFEAITYKIQDAKSNLKGSDIHLFKLLEIAAEEVRKPEKTVFDVLSAAHKVSLDFEKSSEAAGDDSRKLPVRPFYRGVLDFELVESAAAGMARLVDEAVKRFSDKYEGITADYIRDALDRIEENEGIEPDALIWQIEDHDEKTELFESIMLVIEEMETEKRIRRAVYYDEWNHKLDDYNKHWCRVREMDMPATSLAFYNDTIKEHYGVVSQLRRHFSLLRPDRVQRFFREERGDDIDYSAAIEALVDRHAGITPSDKVYIRREKNLRDVSVAFLADMSYSTSDELPSGKRIIDVEREGLVLMSEALESIGDQWAVYGFSSNKKDKVDFFVVHDFNTPFNEQTKMRFEGLKPMAQTRLGAVIRHASAQLQKQSSRIRLLILLSDGRPYDLDYGDAEYALEDTRRAIWEGRRKGLTFFCITVDKKSREYLPYMYGESNYTVINNIEALPLMLPLIYKRLTS